MSSRDFKNVNFAISLHRVIATLLKRICRIDIDVSDGLCKLKYITRCCGLDISSSYLVIIVSRGSSE